MSRGASELVLSGKKLVQIPPGLPADLQILWLNDNDITQISNVNHLYRLKQLYLSGNQISDLEDSLRYFRNLEVLSLSNNKLRDLDKTVKSLSYLKNLKQIDLSGNRIADDEQYRSAIISALPTIELFDNHVVTKEEKTAYLSSALGKKKQAKIPLAFGKCLPRDQINQTQLSRSQSQPKERERATSTVSPGIARSGSASSGGKRKGSQLLTAESVCTRDLSKYVAKVRSQRAAAEKAELEAKFLKERELSRPKELPRSVPVPTFMQPSSTSSTSPLSSSLPSYGFDSEDIVFERKKDTIKEKQRKDIFISRSISETSSQKREKHKELTIHQTKL